MLIFKPGTSVRKLHPDLLRGLADLHDALCTACGVTAITVTSVNDGQHKLGSLHYTGCAVDVRSKTLAPAGVTAALATFGARTTTAHRDFDLLWEARGRANEHLHLELDPKPHPSAVTAHPKVQGPLLA